MLNESINQTFKFLKSKNIELKPFHLTIKSNLEEHSNKKYGFGSSSALITGVIKSILLFHEYNFDKYLIYKIAVLTKYKNNDISSGGDIAAAIFGGFLYYKRYDVKWLEKNISKNNILEIKWKGLKIREIKTNLCFNAIWTKTSYTFKNLSSKLTNNDYKIANKIVKSTYRNLLNNNYLKLKEDINNYQLFLERILETDNLYTNELKLAISIAKSYNLSAKISGAGGGDSVILIYPKGFNFSNLKEDLKDNNLQLIEI